MTICKGIMKIGKNIQSNYLVL